MSKKSFTDSPALAFINAQEDTQQVTQEAAQEVTRDTEHAANQTLQYTRTQGRKGYKKPRINLAFESDQFLDDVRAHADRLGVSITQYVNMAVADYMMKGGD